MYITDAEWQRIQDRENERAYEAHLATGCREDRFCGDPYCPL